MTRYERIIVYAPAPVDPAAAVRRASDLAGVRGTVTVVDVIPELSGLARVVLSPSLQELYLRERRNDLQRLVATLETPRPIEVHVETGHAAAGLVRLVIERRADLVIKVASGTGGEPMAPIDMRLLRKCPVPVWVVTADAAGEAKRVLAAVDPAPAEPERSALNRSILDTALTVAAHDGAVVSVVHAWDFYGEGLLMARVPAADVERYVEETRRASEAALHELLVPYGAQVSPENVHVVRGDAARGIVKMAAALPADLVVMGTVARTGIPGLVMGNTAEQVLRRIQCSVLTLKPEGFVSPLAPRAAVAAGAA